MKSKWQDLAERMRLDFFGEEYDDTNTYYDNVLLMCRIAEEVEKETISKMLSSNPEDVIFYSKEQVEQLLTNQRQLCANKADVKFIKSDVTNCFIRDYNDYTSRLAVADEDTILNAKLNID